MGHYTGCSVPDVKALGAIIQEEARNLGLDTQAKLRAHVLQRTGWKVSQQMASKILLNKIKNPKNSVHTLKVLESFGMDAHGNKLVRPERPYFGTPSFPAERRRKVGAALAQILHAKGHDSAWLARRLKCDQTAADRMLSGDEGNLWAFAEACMQLGCSLEEIVYQGQKLPWATERYHDLLKRVEAALVSAKP